MPRAKVHWKSITLIYIYPLTTKTTNLALYLSIESSDLYFTIYTHLQPTFFLSFGNSTRSQVWSFSRAHISSSIVCFYSLLDRASKISFENKEKISESAFGKRVWDQEIPCSMDFIQQRWVFKFLAGLNSIFYHVRQQILSHERKSDLDEAISIVLNEPSEINVITAWNW